MTQPPGPVDPTQAGQVTEAEAQGKPLVLGENHPLARQAFVRQTSQAAAAQQPS